MVQEEGFDLIHSHGARGNMMAAFLSKRTGLPTVSTVHSDYRLDYLGRPLSRLTYGTINTLALRKLDYRIGVSDAMVCLLYTSPYPIISCKNVNPFYKSLFFCPAGETGYPIFQNGCTIENIFCVGEASMNQKERNEMRRHLSLKRCGIHKIYGCFGSSGKAVSYTQLSVIFPQWLCCSCRGSATAASR